jgi:hypothetical protein
MLSLLAIAQTTARDCSRRGSLMLVLAAGCSLMLMLRYTVLYGLGDELALFREYAAANLAICGALAAILCAVPVSRAGAVAAADAVVATRPLGSWVLPVGRWMGTVGLITGMFAVWCLFLYFALAWYASGEPALFVMNGETTPLRELLSLLPAAGLALMQTALLAAVAVAAAPGGMAAAALSVLGLLVAGVLVPSAAEHAGGFAAAAAQVLPDLRPFSAVEAAHGTAAGLMAPAALQLVGYGGCALAVAAMRRG